MTRAALLSAACCCVVGLLLWAGIVALVRVVL